MLFIIYSKARMRWHWRPWPAVIVPSLTLIVHLPDVITPLPIYRFPNEIAHNVPNNIPINPPLCSFAFFKIVLLTALINKTDSSKDLTVFMTSFAIINVLILNPKRKKMWIAASVADAANPNGIKTLVFSKFSGKEKPVFSIGPKILPKNPPDYLTLWNQF